jgi:hemoglobin/transferrin/lactoferrin receptor protein
MTASRPRTLQPSLALALLVSAPSLAAGAQEPASEEPPARAQESQPAKPREPRLPGAEVGRTVVTATRRDEDPLEVPFAIESVEAATIRDRGYRTVPQALRDLPGVMVQETSFGQGSPYIRGFTGFRNLFLIDGIRLNNSVFREGPNQYWNTVDPFSIERLEVLKGPSSVLYGSDAIGGTVNAVTRSPYGLGGLLHYRYASAEDSHIGRAEVSLAHGDSLGLLLGATGKLFGDVEGGADTGEQPNTGYDEYDADAKLETLLDPDTRLVLAYQRVRQNDVPRTHSTVFAVPFEGTAVGSDLRRDLDQERQLAYVQLHGEDGGGFVDSYSLSLSWHEQQETRDRIRGNGARELQGFEVDTLGLFAHAGTPSAIGHLTWGLDYYHDQVDSFATTNPVQGPVADDAAYDLVGLFVQDEIDVLERLTLTLGGRFDYAAADAHDVLDPATSTEFSIEEDWSALVGSARFLYRLVEERVHLFGGVSQGFRAPNLSDLTRFDTARSNEFEIPSPGLDPEHYLSYELGVKTEDDDLSTQVALFWTDIEDQIVRFPTGNTNPDGEFEITKDNLGDGWIYGIEAGAAWRFAREWTLFGNATFLEGKVETFPTSAQVKEEEFIDRLMPLTGELGVRWEDEQADRWVELLGVGAADADRLSTRDEEDDQRIPPGGTPGYFVLHARAGWRVHEHVVLDLGLENLTDEDYRIHGSGSNMPGFSVVVGLTLTL